MGNGMERLIAVLPLWLVVVAYLGVRRQYDPRNLALVALGFAAFLVALALADQFPNSAVSMSGALVSLAALGGGLIVRGVDAERSRTRLAPGAGS